MLQQAVRRRRNDEGGFTLIELLIVIVILGVLAAIVVFSVAAITDTGEDAACEASTRTVEVAVEAHYAQRGTWPRDVAVLQDAGFLRQGAVADAAEHNVVVGDRGAVRSDCT